MDSHCSPPPPQLYYRKGLFKKGGLTTLKVEIVLNCISFVYNVYAEFKNGSEVNQTERCELSLMG